MSEKIRVYVGSEFGSSQELPDFLKDLCEREECVYRVTKLEQHLTKKEKRESQETVRRKLPVKHPDGKETTMDFVSFDRKGKRYFLELETLQDLFQFSMDYNEHSEFGFVFQQYDPDDEEDLLYLEAKFGLDMPPCMCLEVKDGILVLDSDMGDEEDDEE